MHKSVIAFALCFLSLNLYSQIPAITLGNLIKTYGDPDFELDAVSDSDGLIHYTIESGDAGAVALSGANNKLVTIQSAGSVVIRVNQNPGTNYGIGTLDITLTINKATIDVIAENKSRTYGKENPGFTFNYDASDFKNGDNFSVLDAHPVAASAADVASDVGSYPISVSGGSDGNYNFHYVSGTLTISKATVTVTAEAKGRVYGVDNPDFTVTYTASDFKNGQNSSVLDTGPVATSAAEVTSDVGSYPISVSGGSDGNYDFHYVSGTLTISKATITVTADDQGRIYGNANPAFTVSYTASDFKNGQNSSVLDIKPWATSAASETSNAGPYPIVASGGTDGNYTFSYVPGTLTVSKATVTVTAENKGRVYGNANPAFTVSYTAGDFKNGEDFSVLDTKPVATSAAVATTNTGDYSISASGGADGNYDFHYVSGTLTISKATVTVTAEAKSRVYGNTNPAFTISYTASDFKNGQSSSVLDTEPVAGSAATVNSDVGNYAISVSGGTDENYTFNYVSGTLTISKATITVTADDNGRTYGSANPAFTVSYAAGDFKNGQNSSVLDTKPVATSAASATSNVGTYPIVASGGTDGNYTFSYVPGTLTVSKATVTVTAENKGRVYGNANPAFTVSYTAGDFKNGENFSVLDTKPVATSAAVAATNTGDYSISASGGADGNYDFHYVSGTLTISKATVTVTAEAKSRVYGVDNPVFTVTYTASDFKNGQSSSVLDTEPVAGSAATVNSDVGNYAISVSGGTDGNYTFNYVSGTLTISKATVTVMADDQGRIYGNANPAFTVRYTAADFKNGQSFSVLDIKPIATSAANATSNVGTYPIVVSGGTDGNYTFSYVPGTLTVSKATVTVTAENKTRLYGNANPAFTVSYAAGDFKNGENFSVLDIKPVATSAAVAATNTGDYSISASGGADGNYDFNYVSGTLTISKATVTVTAENKSRVYGNANPAFTISYTASDFKNGQSSSVLDTEPVAGSVATITSNAGVYAISASGGADGNYTFNYVQGTLTISKATVTVTAADQSRLYGDANPVFDVIYDASHFKNGESFSALDIKPVATSAANATSNVGTYSIVASGGTDGNYTFSYVPGTLTIVKATISATADDKSRIYGDADPSFTITYSGLKNGEGKGVIDAPPAVQTTATITSNTGNYTITLAGGSDNNYNIDLTESDGTLTVLKARLNVTAQNEIRVYGDVNPDFTYHYKESDFRNGESHLVIDTPPVASNAATAMTGAGSYPIAVSGGADGNYTFNYIAGTLTITPAPLHVIVAPGQVQFTTRFDTLGLEVTFNGFKNGEHSSVLKGKAIYDVSPGAYSKVRTETVYYRASGLSSDNYTIHYDAALLIVHRWPAIEREPDGYKGCEGTNAVFTLQASADPNPVFAWLFRTNAQEPFRPMRESGLVYSGESTGTLVIGSISKDLLHYQFRSIVSSPEGWGPAVASRIVMLDTLQTPPLAYVHKKGSSMLINTDGHRAIYYWGIKNDTLPGASKNYLQFDTPLPLDLSDYWSAACNDNGCCVKSFYGKVENNLPPYDPGISPTAYFNDDKRLVVEFENVYRGKVFVSVLNIQGQLVRDLHERDKVSNVFDEPYDVGELKTGIYLIRVYTSEMLYVRRILR